LPRSLHDPLDLDLDLALSPLSESEPGEMKE
jgi:hypothetical protein